MIGSYQERRKLERRQPVRPQFATVAAVFDDGVTLTFPDGQTGRKHYRTAAQYAPTAGDHVHISWCGTYVVDYKL